MSNRGWQRPEIPDVIADSGADIAGQWTRPNIEDPDPRPWEETEIYTEWKQRVAMGGPNDMVIAITPSSWTGVSGTGKTTAATSLAKSFDQTDEGFDGESKSSLDAAEMAYQILPSVESGSAVIFDEAQGAPGTNSVNSRRGMKSSAIDAMNAILANRDQRLTVIIVGQQLGMLDKNLYPMIDAWLLIRREPDMPDGPLMTYYNIFVDDFDLKSPEVETKGIDDLEWPFIPANDPDYAALEQKKQAAKQRQSESDDEGEEDDSLPIPSGLDDMPKEYRDPIIKDLRACGVGRKKLSEAADLTPQMISKIAPVEGS
jgi:hypothetical protein